MKGCQEPALRSGRDAPSSFGQRRRRDAGPSATGPKLSACGAGAAARQGSSPEWAETRVEVMAPLSEAICAAPGAARLEPVPKRT